MISKRGQIGMEYLMIMGFLTFVLLAVIATAYFQSNNIKDMIRARQVEVLGSKLVSSAEEVFYSGEPSKVTISLNIPDGIEDINITASGIVITYYLSSGKNKIMFNSDVTLSGEIIESSGLRKITLTARENDVQIS
ncbi:MAG: hypothetical protein ACP5D2_01430 [Candidatus Nanoarchaeia archaeon]